MEYTDVKTAEYLVTGMANRACEACHKKKTRCDMQQPACGLCRRTGRECHFPSTRKRPSRQEPSERAKIQKVNENLDRLVELLEADSSNIHTPSRSTSSDVRSAAHHVANSPRSTNTGTMNPAFHHPSSDHSPNTISNLAAPSDFVGEGTQPRTSPVSRDLAVHLVAVFFDKVACWLYIFHRPTFLDWCDQTLVNADDALTGLRPVDAMLLSGIFALAARFSDHASLVAVAPKARGNVFQKTAEFYFGQIRDSGAEEAGFGFLQACVLLAVYHYGAGNSKKGWLITHMCIRGCYELGLHQLDDTDGLDHTMGDSEWLDKELLRRVFWAIWDIDSFGSIMRQRPFSIDRRHIRVKLPVSDEAWYGNIKVDSGLFIHGPECWKSLAGTPNQDERAWAILAKSLVGYVHDLSLFREGITDEHRATIDNNISCFKLAMPETFHLSRLTAPGVEIPPHRRNFIIAANLYLSATSFNTARVAFQGQRVTSAEQARKSQTTLYNSRVAELSEIMRRWPSDHIQYVCPTIACTLLTYDETLVNLLPPSVLVSSYRDLSSLILAKFAERWPLGAVLLRIRELAHNYHASDEEAKTEMIRQYPIFFHHSIRTKQNQQRLRSQLNKQSLSGGRANPGTPDQRQAFPNPLSPPTSEQSPDQRQANLENDGVTISDDVYDPSKYDIPNFPSLTSLGQSPMGEDLDLIFSGFVQEPLWQDFGVFNFIA